MWFYKTMYIYLHLCRILKLTILTYFQHLNVQILTYFHLYVQNWHTVYFQKQILYEYWNRGILLLLVVFSCQINYLVFSCIIKLYNVNVLILLCDFCSFSFPIIGLHDVEQDFNLNHKIITFKSFNLYFSTNVYFCHGPQKAFSPTYYDSQ